MQPPRTPADESRRLAALRSLALLDTDHEERFDRITRLACRIFDVPIAAISLVDQNREWFKSCVGVPAREGARANSFCGYTILESETLIIPDAAADERFTDNPQVVEDGIRFYAGHPLRTPDGHRIGAFCIKDRRPRRLRPDQIESLRALAAIAETELYTAEVLELKRELDTRSQGDAQRRIATDSSPTPWTCSVSPASTGTFSRSTRAGRRCWAGAIRS